MERSTHLKLANALGGLGAGMQGNSAQWQAMRQKDMQLRDEKRRKAMLLDAFKLKTFLDANDIDSAIKLTGNRMQNIQQLGGDDKHTRAYFQRLQSGNPDDIKWIKNDLNAVLQHAAAVGDIDIEAMTGGKRYARRSATPYIDPKTGQWMGPTYDPNTDTWSVQAIPGAFGETPDEETARRIGEAQDKKTNELAAGRTSDIKKELSERYRNYRRQGVTVNRALLAQSNLGTSGYEAKAKMILAKIFPDIDVSNEAAYDQATKQLALDFLASFKGPTTDFEFGVVQDIAGNITDPKTAAKAKLAAIQRNGWFMERELAQFDKFVANGGNPDYFGFDMMETINVGGNSYTLQDLQDTGVQNHMTIQEVIDALKKLEK